VSLFNQANSLGGGYSFNQGVVNPRNSHNGSAFGHYQSNNTWSSPSRVDSPNNWHYTGSAARRSHQGGHHGSPVSHQQHHNGHNSHQQGHHNSAFSGHGGGWENSGASFGMYDSQSQRHHNHHHAVGHHSHSMNLNANLEQVAAYVSS
jgi:hypothetical protein